MEGKRTTTLMLIMCLVILSLTIDSATADCDCCVSLQAKACCQACLFVASDSTCKNTCCYPCTMADSGKFTRVTLYSMHLLHVHTNFVAYHGLIHMCSLPCIVVNVLLWLHFPLPISQLQALHTHTHTHTQHLILYFNYKIYYTLMGFPYFNLTDVAKMDEMEVLVIAQEGQA
jgi:hypothetical protein